MASVKAIEVDENGKGRYKCTFSLGFNSKGDRQRSYETITATSEEDAKTKAAKQEGKLIALQETGSSKLTLEKFVEDSYLPEVRRTLAFKTVFRYEELLKLHILPNLGNDRLKKIDIKRLKTVYNELRTPRTRTIHKRDGSYYKKNYDLSERTLQSIHKLISVIMQMAFIDGDLDANPCARLPKGYFAVGSKDAKAFEKADREKIFKALENSSIKFKTFCHIAMGSGARLGELMGLEWEDIDYDKNRIHIIRTSQHINGKPLITKEPKTKSSIRWIPLNSYVMELIKKLEIANKKQRLLLGNKWGGSNRLFVTAEGVTINPNTPSGEFHAFLDKIGVDTSEYSLHNCRHTYASMLIAKGTDIATVQKLMGHGSPRITLECYTHFFNEREDNTVEQLSEMYDCVQESK